jgi:hypothetical protein
MISNRRFISSFTSFWKELTPVGNRFVRDMNYRDERFCKPLVSEVDAKRRGEVSDIGFYLFKAALEEAVSLDAAGQAEEAVRKICSPSSPFRARLRSFGETRFRRPNKRECLEAVEIAKRLLVFFREYKPSKQIVLSPRFPGCGFLDGGEGDVLADKTLYEIKGGQRPLRLVDVRQILVYLALNESLRSHEIDRVGFVNPRIGIHFELEVDKFASCISGKYSAELLAELIEFVSNAGVSR